MALREVPVFFSPGTPSASDVPKSLPSCVIVDEKDSRIYAMVRGALLLVDVATATTEAKERVVTSVAAGSDLTSNICVVPWAGVVSAVKFIAQTTLTGANTDSRTLNLCNKGAAGSGTTLVASKAFVDTVNATATVPTAITLSETAEDLVVAAGDVLQWSSIHVGATGLADPGGLVVVTLTRT